MLVFLARVNRLADQLVVMCRSCRLTDHRCDDFSVFSVFSDAVLYATLSICRYLCSLFVVVSVNSFVHVVVFDDSIKRSLSLHYRLDVVLVRRRRR